MKAKKVDWLRKKLEKIRSADGYVAGESVKNVVQRFGISLNEIIKLNSNENFFIPKDELVKLMVEAVEEFDPRIYPCEEDEFKWGLSRYLNVPADHVIIGNGSDELIELIARFFLYRGDQAISIAPTYSLYKQRVNLLGAKCLEAPLKKDFSLDTDQILALSTPKTKVLFLCSPNNPTANQFDITSIQALIKEFPGVVVVDEAYAEYAEYSIVPLISKFDNLIVLRTFSKAFGLAGFRLGYCVANTDIAEALSKKIRLPYPVSSIALEMGLKLLANIQIVKKAVEQLKIERKALIEKLNKVKGVKAFDSQTNFVLFQTVKQYEKVHQNLLSRGILIKKLGRVLHFNDCLRTTVGLAHMNAKLLQALEEIINDKGA